MTWVIISVAIALLSLADYFYINRKEIFVEKKVKNLKGVLPKGWKQIVCYVAIPISLVGIAWMLHCFYRMPVIYVLKRVCLISVMWPIAICDFREYRIPNKLILWGLLLRVPLLIAELFVHFDSVGATVVNELVAMLGSAVVCLVCMLLSRGSLGMGDLKLVMCMSLFQGVEGICASMFVSVFFSALIASGLLIFRKKSRKDAIPFAPFILAGTIVSIILTGV